jgi:hypothetical protein
MEEVDSGVPVDEKGEAPKESPAHARHERFYLVRLAKSTAVSPVAPPWLLAPDSRAQLTCYARRTIHSLLHCRDAATPPYMPPVEPPHMPPS